MASEDEQEDRQRVRDSAVDLEKAQGEQGKVQESQSPAEAVEAVEAVEEIGEETGEDLPLLTSSAKASDPGKASREAHEEGLSRKRDREGSIEPSSAPSTFANEKSPSDVLPAKKNKLLGCVSDAGEKSGDDEGPSTASAEDPQITPKIGSGDNEKVGQIRQRVEELSYDERETKRADLGEKRGSSTSEQASSDTSITALPEKKLPSQTVPAATSAATPTRKQPTFSSFSASSSPFATSSASAGVSGPSWLAGSSGSGPSSPSSSSGPRTSGVVSATTGAIKPNTRGGESSSIDEAIPPPKPSPLDGLSTKSRPSPAPSSVPPPAKSSAGLGFGAFAASRPFTGGNKAITTAVTITSSSSAVSGNPGGSETINTPPPGESIFDQQQTVEDEALGNETESEKAENGEGGKGKIKVQRVTEAELATGEEHERTMHSVRAKLYTMSKDGQDGTAADGTWKERGTGTLRVNIPKDVRVLAQGGSARLVMRAEGVFRLILNVALFKGMKVELAQEKFVRIVALEAGKLVHFAIKVSNPSAAYELYRAIKHHIPAAAASKTGTNGAEVTIPPALPPRSSTATGFAFHEHDEDGQGLRGNEAA